MLNMLDKRFASNRTVFGISVLHSMHSKQFGPKEGIPKFVDEFETLSAQLEGIGSETPIQESHKVSLGQHGQRRCTRKHSYSVEEHGY